MALPMTRAVTGLCFSILLSMVFGLLTLISFSFFLDFIDDRGVTLGYYFFGECCMGGGIMLIMLSLTFIVNLSNSIYLMKRTKTKNSYRAFYVSALTPIIFFSFVIANIPGRIITSIILGAPILIIMIFLVLLSSTLIVQETGRFKKRFKAEAGRYCTVCGYKCLGIPNDSHWTCPECGVQNVTTRLKLPEES